MNTRTKLKCLNILIVSIGFLCMSTIAYFLPETYDYLMVLGYVFVSAIPVFIAMIITDQIDQHIKENYTTPYDKLSELLIGDDGARLEDVMRYCIEEDKSVDLIGYNFDSSLRGQSDNVLESIYNFIK